MFNQSLKILSFLTVPIVLETVKAPDSTVIVEGPTDKRQFILSLVLEIPK